MHETDILTDSQIVSLVLKGQKDMYAILVTRYEPKLLRYAVFLLKDQDMASDAVQETFIKGYMSLHSFQLHRSFSSWIYRIVHNEAMNLIKRNKKTSTFTDLGDNDNEFFEPFKTDNLIDKNLLKASVQKCLSKIDTKHREVLGLYYFNNLKYDEIGEILHMPTSTVGVRIKRAKAALKITCLQEGVTYE